MMKDLNGVGVVEVGEKALTKTFFLTSIILHEQILLNIFQS